MGLSCGGSCMKVLLIIFNVLFFLGGAAILGIGIWLTVDPAIKNYISEVTPDGTDPYWKGATILLMTVGAATFVIGFFGCCGACKESPCMLTTFGALLIIIVIAEIVGIVLIAVFRNKLGDLLEDDMKDQVKLVTRTNPGTDLSPLSDIWHSMQTDLKCCGATNYLDYESNSNFNRLSYPVPLTCCRLSNDDHKNPIPDNRNECFIEAREGVNTNKDELRDEGCYDALNDWLRSKAAILIGVGAAIAAIQLIGIIFAFCLRKEINEGEKYA